MSNISWADMNEFRLVFLIKALRLISNLAKDERTQKYASEVLELDNKCLEIYGVIQDEDS